MKLLQTYLLNYILVILLTFSATWYFISDDKNKLVTASEKSIESVVTITSSNSLMNSRTNNGIGSGVIFSDDGYIVTNLHILSGSNINVRLNNGKNYSANIIGIDNKVIEFFLQKANEMKDNFSCLGPRYQNISEKTLRQSNRNIDVGYIKAISGAAMFFNTKNFDLIGGFDENIFLYFEETDYCKRGSKLKFLCSREN